MGALGPVTLARLGEICDAVGGARPLTAALGDALDEAATEAHARAYARTGAGLVKIGLLGTTSTERAMALVSAAVRGTWATASGVVVVAYADAPDAGSIAIADIVEVAARCGARGVLLDTLDKDGPGLFGVLSPRELGVWVGAAQAEGLLVAVAGKLTATDLPRVRASGADVAGVRGAACVGGRSGHVSPALVRALRSCCGPTVEAAQRFG